jgi:uncharacterized membrane protein YuzA (DUF378 family)
MKKFDAVMRIICPLSFLCALLVKQNSPQMWVAYLITGVSGLYSIYKTFKDYFLAKEKVN